MRSYQFTLYPISTVVTLPALDGWNPVRDHGLSQHANQIKLFTSLQGLKILTMKGVRSHVECAVPVLWQIYMYQYRWHISGSKADFHETVTE